MIEKMEEIFRSQVIPNPPMRMLLSREGSPRYSRLSPETANVFDNLHMLHGITYDIFVYEGWTIAQKRKELYRVLDAMSYQPEDDKLVRKFTTQSANINPLVYDDWLKNVDGAMTEIIMEMLDEMMKYHEGGAMHRHHGGISPEMQQQLKTQLKLKLTPGIQEGEIPGSFLNAMMQIMPDMKISPAVLEPGEIPPMMIEAMLKGWEQKYANLPDIEPISMEQEPDAGAFMK